MDIWFKALPFGLIFDLNFSRIEASFSRTAMDDIYLPDEEGEEDVEFERNEIEPERTSNGEASKRIGVSFDRFVLLVANHSFEDVIERNKDEEVIISTNLLTDLANARRHNNQPKGTLLALAGGVIGILLGYFLFAI